MIKRIFISILVVIVLAAVGAGIYKSTQASASQDNEVVQARENGLVNENAYRGGQDNKQVEQPQPSGQVEQLQTSNHVLPAPGELSEVEAEGLLFMREEEKLARDVYTALYATWELPLFQNIANSEQAHMDAVKVLLDTYNLVDSAQEQAGVFTNPELQTLYDELVALGNQSLADALKVGAAIEEIDILDLQTRLAQTDSLDIQQVYNNLLMGSENHLRSFTNTLMTQTGETYQPQYLSMEEYQLIVSQTGQGNGNGNSGRGGGGQGRRGGKS
ncbi:DUF2202 domain-containing protein [Chloroflexota bacterium]